MGTNVVNVGWTVVRPFVESGVIRTVTLTSDEMESLASDPLCSALGLVDLQVLWVATKEKGILLTGDLELREEAKKRKVTVHGLLWIIEQLIQEKRLKPPEAAKALRLVLAKNAYLLREPVMEWLSLMPNFIMDSREALKLIQGNKSV